MDQPHVVESRSQPEVVTRLNRNRGGEDRRLSRRDRRVGRETHMTLHAVGGITGQFDGLLTEQGGIANKGPFEPLLARLTHDARALLLVAVDKDRIGIRSLELHDIGREIHLTGLGRHVSDELDVAFG